MYSVYILYSIAGKKSYVGFTNNVDRRLQEHNVTSTKGFTLRYRPWTLIRTENFTTKAEAMQREKFLKTGRGREEIKIFITSFFGEIGAVSATAEKD